MITLVNTCFVIYKEQFSLTRFLENVRAYSWGIFWTPVRRQSSRLCGTYRSPQWGSRGQPHYCNLGTIGTNSQ